MRKAVKVLVVYLLGLSACSLIFSWLKISTNLFNYTGQGLEMEVSTMLIPTIIGGLIALKITLPPRSFKIFLIVYFSLWVIRILLIYIAREVGEVTLFNKTYHFDLIIYNYYQTVSRLQTPLPFIIYWFINYLFTKVIKSGAEVKEGETEQEENKGI